MKFRIFGSLFVVVLALVLYVVISAVRNSSAEPVVMEEFQP